MNRRGLLRAAAGGAALAALPWRAFGAGQEGAARGSGPDITGRLARYMAGARTGDLPPSVVLDAKHRILDTLAAMISGANLPPGEAAIRFIRAQGGVAEASVVASGVQTTAINAALANGMCAHADETDDFEPVTKAHPGCAVVPAALAVGERGGASGRDLIRAVTLGYDLCCRFLMALGPDHVRATHRSAEGTSATFGSAGAAASLLGLDATRMRYVLSYAAQQVSGLWSWVGDTDHVEKAFDFGGMGARNGVTAALMVHAGFTGVPDVLDGTHNMLVAMSAEPRPGELLAGLGSRFFVSESAIKTFSVGYPVQAALDATLALRRQHGLAADRVAGVTVTLPADGAAIVNDSAMPDVNCQYLVAVALLEGAVSFADSHSRERMLDPRVQALRAKVRLVGDRALMVPEAPRSARVEITTTDGRTVSHFTPHPSGTKENPLDTAGVNAKARALMSPVVGAERTDEIIRLVSELDAIRNVRDLTRLLAT